MCVKVLIKHILIPNYYVTAIFEQNLSDRIIYKIKCRLD